MIRGEIKVNYVRDIKEVYSHLCDLPSKQFNVVRIENKLKSDIVHICVNFIWDNSITYS